MSADKKRPNIKHWRPVTWLCSQVAGPHLGMEVEKLQHEETLLALAVVCCLLSSRGSRRTRGAVHKEPMLHSLCMQPTRNRTPSRAGDTDWQALHSHRQSLPYASARSVDDADRSLIAHVEMSCGRRVHASSATGTVPVLLPKTRIPARGVSRTPPGSTSQGQNGAWGVACSRGRRTPWTSVRLHGDANRIKGRC